MYFVYADPVANAERNIFRAGFKAEILHETINEDDLDFSLATTYSVVNVSNPDVNEGLFDVKTQVSKQGQLEAYLSTAVYGVLNPTSVTCMPSGFPG